MVEISDKISESLSEYLILPGWVERIGYSVIPVMDKYFRLHGVYIHETRQSH